MAVKNKCVLEATLSKFSSQGQKCEVLQGCKEAKKKVKSIQTAEVKFYSLRLEFCVHKKKKKNTKTHTSHVVMVSFVAIFSLLGFQATHLMKTICQVVKRNSEVSGGIKHTGAHITLTGEKCCLEPNSCNALMCCHCAVTKKKKHIFLAITIAKSFWQYYSKSADRCAGCVLTVLTP